MRIGLLSSAGLIVCMVTPLTDESTQVRDDGMHSFLPSMDERSQRLSAIDEELDRELAFASLRIPPQSEEALRMRGQLRTQRRVREFALEKGVLPLLPGS